MSCKRNTLFTTRNKVDFYSLKLTISYFRNNETLKGSKTLKKVIFQTPPEAKILGFGGLLDKWIPSPRGVGGLPKLAELSFGVNKFSGIKPYACAHDTVERLRSDCIIPI